MDAKVELDFEVFGKDYDTSTIELANNMSLRLRGLNVLPKIMAMFFR